MLKRVPGALGGRSVLDEHGQLWAEFRQYEAQESIAEADNAARATRERARHHRRLRRGGGRGG